MILTADDLTKNINSLTAKIIKWLAAKFSLLVSIRSLLKSWKNWELNFR